MCYSFWKLLSKQWSWKNDRISILLGGFLTLFILSFMDLNIQVSFLLSFYQYYLVIVVLYLILLSTWLLIYHSVKLLVFIFFCWFISYYSKQGEIQAIELYKEALTWRQ